MTVILDSTFATAEDTAKILGVSKARLNRLLRLAVPEAVDSERQALRADGKRAAASRHGRRIQSAKRKKQTRGKTKKAAH